MDEPRRWTLLEPEEASSTAGSGSSARRRILRCPPGLNVTSRLLACGVSDGVQLVAVSSDDLSFKVMPTRGKGLWRGSYLGMPLTGAARSKALCTRSTSSHWSLPGCDLVSDGRRGGNGPRHRRGPGAWGSRCRTVMRSLASSPPGPPRRRRSGRLTYPRRGASLVRAFPADPGRLRRKSSSRRCTSAVVPERVP